MDNNIKSSLEKIGYKKFLPKDFNINDYDVISLTKKMEIRLVYTETKKKSRN